MKADGSSRASLSPRPDTFSERKRRGATGFLSTYIPPAEMSRIEREKASLFSPAHYDDDAASVNSGSEQESDADDGASVDGKTSMEIAQHDRELLAEEDAREALLSGGTGQDEQGAGVKIGKREKRRYRRDARRDRRRGRRGKEDESEIMYEMEEGGHQSETDTSRGSSESDQQRFHAVHEEKSVARRRRYRRVGIHLAIIFLFLVLLFAAYRASRASSQGRLTILSSNGTAHFAPTTILISLDGFRADFLNRGLTPTLNSFVQNGVSPLYMLPSFPSLTFPNHYTMVTGLFPESHGIVGNSFWDPTFKEDFSYTKLALSMQPKWWGGEPLWVTAESQGVRAAIHMWPGSEAHIGGVEPTYVDKYNGSEVLHRKVDRVLQLLDMPGPESPRAMPNSPRPQLIAAYVPVVDTAGHKYGPNSTEIRKTIQEVDNMLHDLFAGLEARNLTDIVNVVVVSDHGMATTSTDRLIQLEDLVDTSLIEHTDGWPLYGLRPKNIDDLDTLYAHLHTQAETNPNYDVYLRDKDMPKRYHFSNNERIAPLWIIPKAGWAIVTKDEFDVEKGLRDGLVYHPRGLHGYDNENPLMRAIFVAKGPAFPHKPGSRVEVFQNTEVYNIVCDSIGVEPKANNGTLRLPLKPVGLHTDESTPPLENPPDPPAVVSSAAVQSPTALASLANADVTGSAGEPSPDTVSTLSPENPTKAGNASDDAGQEEDEDPAYDRGKNENLNWWHWLGDKLHGAKGWIEEHIGKGAKIDEESP